MGTRQPRKTPKPAPSSNIKRTAITALTSAIAATAVAVFVAPPFAYVEKIVDALPISRTAYGVGIFDLNNLRVPDETYTLYKSIASNGGELRQDASQRKLEEMQRPTAKRFWVEGLTTTISRMNFEYRSASGLPGKGQFRGLDASFSGTYIGTLRAYGKQGRHMHCGLTTFWAVVGDRSRLAQFPEILQNFISTDKARAAQMLKAAEESDFNEQLRALTCNGGQQSASANPMR